MIIKDVMTRNPICVEVDTSIVKAKEILNKNNFSKLPVVDKQKKLVGIITKNDISKVSPSDATTLDKYEISALLDNSLINFFLEESSIIPALKLIFSMFPLHLL